MNEQLELQRLHSLFEKWQEQTSTSYSIEMFFDWVEDKLNEKGV